MPGPWGRVVLFHTDGRVWAAQEGTKAPPPGSAPPGHLMAFRGITPKASWRGPTDNRPRSVLCSIWTNWFFVFSHR